MQEIKENIVFVHASPEDARMFHLYQTILHGENKSYFRDSRECENLGTDNVKSFIASSLRSSSSALFLLKDMNTKEILAHLHIQIGHSSRNKHKAELYLGVLKQFQNIGVGRKLIEIADFWARKENIEKIQLSVFANNLNAIGFYKKFGFEEEAILKKAVKFSDNEYTDEIIMSKFIQPMNLEKKERS